MASRSFTSGCYGCYWNTGNVYSDLITCKSRSWSTTMCKTPAKHHPGQKRVSHTCKPTRAKEVVVFNSIITGCYHLYFPAPAYVSISGMPMHKRHDHEASYSTVIKSRQHTCWHTPGLQSETMLWLWNAKIHWQFFSPASNLQRRRLISNRYIIAASKKLYTKIKSVEPAVKQKSCQDMLHLQHINCTNSSRANGNAGTHPIVRKKSLNVCSQLV